MSEYEAQSNKVYEREEEIDFDLPMPSHLGQGVQDEDFGDQDMSDPEIKYKLQQQQKQNHDQQHEQAELDEIYYQQQLQDMEMQKQYEYYPEDYVNEDPNYRGEEQVDEEQYKDVKGNEIFESQLFGQKQPNQKQEVVQQENDVKEPIENIQDDTELEGNLFGQEQIPVVNQDNLDNQDNLEQLEKDQSQKNTENKQPVNSEQKQSNKIESKIHEGIQTQKPEIKNELSSLSVPTVVLVTHQMMKEDKNKNNKEKIESKKQIIDLNDQKSQLKIQGQEDINQQKQKEVGGTQNKSNQSRGEGMKTQETNAPKKEQKVKKQKKQKKEKTKDKKKDKEKQSGDKEKKKAKKNKEQLKKESASKSIGSSINKIQTTKQDQQRQNKQMLKNSGKTIENNTEEKSNKQNLEQQLSKKNPSAEQKSEIKPKTAVLQTQKNQKSKKKKNQTKVEKKTDAIKNTENKNNDEVPPKDKKEESSAQDPSKKEENVEIPDPEPVITTTMVIKQAQKQRIGSTLQHFLNYESLHKKHSESQKTVIESVYTEMDRRKKQKYTLYYFLKEYFTSYAEFSKDFHEKSYKIPKNERHPETNPYINMQEQCQAGLQQLIFLRKETGNEYQRLNEFINNKTMKQLGTVFNKFIFEMNRVQTNFQNKAKVCSDRQDDYNKYVSKMKKIYIKGREGKKQDEDVFVETCKFIDSEKKFRDELVGLGKQLLEIRKSLQIEEDNLCRELQVVLNNFKNHINTVYNLHKKKFDRVLPGIEQIKSENKFNKICALADLDYIKYALETADKKDLGQISDKNFDRFLQMPHFELITGKATDLLKGMVNKSFNLKNKDQELINTISGNLVVFNRKKVEYRQKFNVKNIQAQIISEGLVQVDEVIPGLIFDSSRTVRLEFKDEDRAEELICFLNEQINQ